MTKEVRIFKCSIGELLNGKLNNSFFGGQKALATSADIFLQTLQLIEFKKSAAERQTVNMHLNTFSHIGREPITKMCV